MKRAITLGGVFAVGMVVERPDAYAGAARTAMRSHTWSMENRDKGRKGRRGNLHASQHAALRS
jgi:hypothetical protein